MKIDIEKGEGIELAKSYYIKVVPSIVFFNSEGELIAKLIGAAPAKEFLQKVDAILNGASTFPSLRKLADAKPNDPAPRYKLAYALYKAGLPSYTEECKKVLQIKDAGAYADSAEFLLVTGGFSGFPNNDYTQFKTFIEKHPGWSTQEMFMASVQGYNAALRNKDFESGMLFIRTGRRVFPFYPMFREHEIRLRLVTGNFSSSHESMLDSLTDSETTSLGILIARYYLDKNDSTKAQQWTVKTFESVKRNYRGNADMLGPVTNSAAWQSFEKNVYPDIALKYALEAYGSYQDADFADTIGELYRLLGDVNNALKYETIAYEKATGKSKEEFGKKVMNLKSRLKGDEK
ncbi:MAG: hypothetical protein ACP5ON_05830 [Bacteroidota bacterium]